MRKVLLPFFACVCGSLTASAAVGDTFKFGDITYEVMSATAAEVSTVPTSITQAIEIPQTVQDGDGNSYTVVGVGERAFQYTKTPTVTLPPTVTYVDYCGFYNCELSSIELPAALTTIGGYAFAYTKLTSISIPEGVEELGASAFNRCDKLMSVNLPSTLRVIGGSCFYKVPFTTITLPEGLETIQRAAFLFSGLESVTLPSTLRTIGEGAFQGTALTAITIPEGVESLGDECFYNSPISEVTLPASLTAVGAGAFSGTNLTEFKVAAGSQSFCVQDGILYNADKTLLVEFPAKSTITEYTLPAATLGICGEAFDRTGIRKITVGSKFRAIDGYAFCNSKLAEINMPESLVFIGEQAFAGTSLTKVVLPSALPLIQNAAFAECKSLSEVTIPSSVKNIQIRAFYGCTSLVTINCLGSVPAELEDWYEADEAPFYQVPSTAVVNVPSTSLDTYKNDTYWKSAFNASQFVGSLPGILTATTITPADGASVASMDGIVFKFTGDVSVVKSAPEVKVVEGRLVAGVPVGETVAVDGWRLVKEGTDGVKLFPEDMEGYMTPFNMELGKNYYVTIPAGIVKDAAGSLNESLTIHYEGAWEAPVVKIENITPADGSSMESLTTIDFTFAEKTNLVSSKLSDIKVIKGELVDGEPTGTSVAVEQWWAKNGTTSGTSLGIFAGDEYDGYTMPISLEKDADYYVVLPAGLFRLATSYNTVSDRIILHYTNDKSGAVEIVEADGADTPKEYYTIDGRRVAEPESGRLYIVRQGSKVSKVIVR